MLGDGYGQMMTEKESTMKTILKKGVILSDFIFMSNKHTFWEEFNMKRMICLFLCIMLLASIQEPVFASSPINNQIKGSSASAAQSTSAQTLFYTAINASKIERPNTTDYFSAPFSMYIDAPKGHSVYVYDYWSFDEANRFDAAFHGSRVVVLAEHREFYCILYYTQKNELKVAWVNAENLVSYYPGNTAQLGWGNSNSRLINAGDPDVSWSRENFVRTKRKFTVLNQAINNVVSFTLDYQVTARNGSESYEVIHVTVYLDQPMTLAAVATVPNCADPNTFVFRQSVLDVMCA